MGNFTNIEEKLDSIITDGVVSCSIEGLEVNVSTLSIDLTATNALLGNVEDGIDEAIDEAITAIGLVETAIGAVEADVETANTNLGTLEDDVEAGNALLATIDADTGSLVTAAGHIKTATEALAAIISSGKLLTTETSAGDILSAIGTLNSAAYAKKKVIVSGYPKAFTGTQVLTVTGTNYSVTNTSSTDALRVQVGDADFSLKPGYGVDEVDCAQFTEMTLTPSSSSGTGIVIVKV